MVLRLDEVMKEFLKKCRLIIVNYFYVLIFFRINNKL